MAQIKMSINALEESIRIRDENKIKLPIRKIGGTWKLCSFIDAAAWDFNTRGIFLVLRGSPWDTHLRILLRILLKISWESLENFLENCQAVSWQSWSIKIAACCKTIEHLLEKLRVQKNPLNVEITCTTSCWQLFSIVEGHSSQSTVFQRNHKGSTARCVAQISSNVPRILLCGTSTLHHASSEIFFHSWGRRFGFVKN